jgi:hypothetical protein
LPAEQQIDLRDWRNFAGPVARAYEFDRAPLVMIEGPVGGGKTTASNRRYLRVATWQQPSPRDGKRKARILVICPTYRRAWDTIIPSYKKVYPENLGDGFKGSRGDPADHHFWVNLSVDGAPTVVDIEVLFRAVNDLDIEDFMRGFEVTAIHLPEADTNGDLDQLLSLGRTRIGRYPEPEDRREDMKPGYAGIFGDANAPIIGSPFYRRFHDRLMPDGVPAPREDRLFRQPGGLSPKAENMANLRKINPNFYVDMAKAVDKYDFGRMVNNRPGFGRHGQPVHPNFDNDVHVSPSPLEVDRFTPIYIGVDAGSGTLKPAATFSQRSVGGQWRTLDEIFLPESEQMTTQEICAEIRRKMDTRFQHAQGALLCMDPAAMSRPSNSEFTTAQEYQHYAQIEAQIAPSNKPEHRRSAMDKLFKRWVGPGRPAKIIDPGCVGLIGGYTGGFHYKKNVGGVQATPAKNDYSHVCEADEYAALTVEGIGPSEDRFIRPDGTGAHTELKVILD